MKKKIKELGKSDSTCLLRASEIQTAELLKSVEIAWKLVLLTGKLLIWLILLNSFKYSAEVQTHSGCAALLQKFSSTMPFHLPNGKRPFYFLKKKSRKHGIPLHHCILAEELLSVSLI